MCKEIFDETSLRGAIIGVWGEYGAHCEVYDMLLKKLNELLTPPPDAAVREAVERLTRCADEDPIPRALADDLRTLLRAVQSPRLTVEQIHAVKDCAEMFNDQEWPGYAERLRGAFPELAGEVGREGL